MSYCFARTINFHKYLIPKRLYTHRSFSAFSSSNCAIIYKINDDKYPPSRTHPPKQMQLRNFSQTLSSNFFDSVTSSEASKWMKHLIIETHDLSGLPWWATIVLTATVMKLVISLPFGIYQQYLVSKLKCVKTELDGIARNLKQEIFFEAKRQRWTSQKANQYLHMKIRQHWNDLVVKHNCHPFKSVILSWSQIPAWLLVSMTLRKYSLEVLTHTSDSIPAALQFQVGGLFWCQNLALPDPTFILPFIITLTSFANIELNAMNNVMGFLARIVPIILRVLTVLVFFISSALPASVSLFWATSSLFALLQHLLLLSPRVRTFFRIPRTPCDLDQPYYHIAFQLAQKCGKLAQFLSRK